MIASWNIKPLNLSIKESTKTDNGLKIKPTFSLKSSSIISHNPGNTKIPTNGMISLENYFSDRLTNFLDQASSVENAGLTIWIPIKKGSVILI